jgi:hypothetical protein
MKRPETFIRLTQLRALPGRRYGGVSIYVPKEITDGLGLTAGDFALIRWDGQSIQVTPIKESDLRSLLKVGVEKDGNP